MHKFGMLFQGSALFDSLRVWENVAFGLIQGRGMDRRHAKHIALEKLAAVGLGPEVGELRPAELSGGMQKRVALARAIAAEPEIIIFDEPTTGLDPIMADVINELIVKCVRDLGATAISITHDMASTRKIADRVAMIYKGKIIWNGAVPAMIDIRATRTSTSSSTAAPTARSRWRSARCDARKPDPWRAPRPAMSASNAAPCIPNGAAGAMTAAAGTRSPRRRCAWRRPRA